MAIRNRRPKKGVLTCCETNFESIYSLFGYHEHYKCKVCGKLFDFELYIK